MPFKCHTPYGRRETGSLSFRKKVAYAAVLALMVSLQPVTHAADPYTYTGTLEIDNATGTIKVTDSDASALTVSGNLTFRKSEVFNGETDAFVKQNGLLPDDSGNAVVNADKVTVSKVNSSGRDPALQGNDSEANGILVQRGICRREVPVLITPHSEYDKARSYEPGFFVAGLFASCT